MNHTASNAAHLPLIHYQEKGNLPTLQMDLSPVGVNYPHPVLLCHVWFTEHFHIHYQMWFLKLFSNKGGMHYDSLLPRPTNKEQWYLCVLDQRELT